MMTRERILSGFMLARFARAQEGAAAIEAALVFPVLLMLLLGAFDMGNAILANTKTLRASQIVADLVSRNEDVNMTGINEAIEAGRLALEPLDTSSFGVDIASVEFDASGNPQILWRETRNMEPASDVLDDVDPLSAAGQGVVVVNVEYDFKPFFSGFALKDFTMQETAFARGRKDGVIERK